MSQAPEPPLTSEPSTSPALVRTMGLFTLVVYGVGDMVGSGIYGTVGKAAGETGNAVWLAFVVSMVAAMLTGLSYASIASRYPKAGGAAFVTQHAYGIKFLSYMIGLTVAASGLTSMATSTNVFSETGAGFFGALDRFGTIHLGAGGMTLVDKPVSQALVILGFLGFMTLVNFRGIRESMWTNLLCTFVEVGGLIFIIIVGARYWGGVNYFETPPDPATGASTSLQPVMLFSGAVLTFFAFVGFEDMLNVAEEVKQPEKTMPWGIILAVAGATLLYIAIAITSVSVVHYSDLAKASAPLELITARAATWLPPWVFKAITMFAVANTVLINFIMGSRLLYGMARQGLVPRMLGHVHAKRRTPHRAILTLLCIVLVLVFVGNVKELAGATGLLLLLSFMVVNGALLVLQRRKNEPRGYFEVPIFVPALGIVVNATLIISKLVDEVRTRQTTSAEKLPALPAPAIAGLMIAGIAVLYFILRPKNISEDTFTAADDEG